MPCSREFGFCFQQTSAKFSKGGRGGGGGKVGDTKARGKVDGDTERWKGCKKKNKPATISLARRHDMARSKRIRLSFSWWKAEKELHNGMI